MPIGFRFFIARRSNRALTCWLPANLIWPTLTTGPSLMLKFTCTDAGGIVLTSVLRRGLDEAGRGRHRGAGLGPRRPARALPAGMGRGGRTVPAGRRRDPVRPRADDQRVARAAPNRSAAAGGPVA